ncbi:MAG TPA: GAF domain-containing protein [Polyangiaceae bacterium]|nr:GAF domain-containing protein [Polyangiaceae bacterium]
MANKRVTDVERELAVAQERTREQDRQVRLYADIVRNVQIGLTVWQPDAPRLPTGDDSVFTLCAFNPAAEKVTGFPLAPSLGMRLLEILPLAAGTPVDGILSRVARDGAVFDLTIERTRNPANPARALNIKVFPLPGGCVGFAFEDITAQAVERRLQAAEQDVLERIASGAPLTDSLTALVRAVEKRLPPMIGSILLVDADGRHIRHGAAPNLPEGYWRAIDGQPIGPRAGSCGTAAFLKRPVFVSDIETDPLWPDYRELALSFGLRACWSIPVLATDQRVLGTFAFYYRATRKPSESDLEITARASRIAGIAIERSQLEQQLRDLSAHGLSAVEEERTAIAREIHDELGQSLTALKMDIAWIERRAAAGELDRGALAEKLAAMSAMTDDVIKDVRRISAELRPGVLDHLGLVAAIEWQAQEFEERTGTTCVVRSTAGDAKLEGPLATAAFRIVQEALTNVSRHAQARQVDVSIALGPDGLALDVRDDGKGITPEAAQSRKSLGLLGMRERAHSFGGTATVEPVLPHGTIVKLRAPLPAGTP